MPDHKPGANLALSVVRAVACQGAVYSRQQTYCNETLLTASRLPTIAVAQSFFTGMSRERIKLLAKRSVVTVLSMPRHRHTETCLNTVAFDSTVYPLVRGHLVTIATPSLVVHSASRRSRLSCAYKAEHGEHNHSSSHSRRRPVPQ